MANFVVCLISTANIIQKIHKKYCRNIFLNNINYIICEMQSQRLQFRERLPFYVPFALQILFVSVFVYKTRRGMFWSEAKTLSGKLLNECGENRLPTPLGQENGKPFRVDILICFCGN